MGWFAPGVFDQQVSPDQWLAFADALDAGDTDAIYRFLADQQLPRALAKPLSLIRPEAGRLEAIVADDVSQSAIDTARATLELLRRASPKTVAEAEQIGKRVAELEAELAAMDRKRTLAEYAKSQLAGLHGVFAELFAGEPGHKVCGSLPPPIHNAFVTAGFDHTALYRKSWTEAFKLQVDRGTVPRRRLRTVK
jgi:hypothetical protein